MEQKNYFLSLLSDAEPDAIAVLKGSSLYPDINGVVKFFALPESGILIATEISDLPDGANEDTPTFFAFHIHETGNCSGDFSATGVHYNPDNVPHPEHAGDLPPLLSNDGYVWMIVYDSFLTLPMILNRSVVIHQNPDDFTTQPTGNSGEKIACGVITVNNGTPSPYPYDDDDDEPED
ncbi:MAG: superoxide dismutase family protein [Lachnospiraceae bacterium]|nr:superoxide dismutase family protein [Lachnospiraceae bacterium]